MIKVARCGSGLGDSIYLRPVAEHLVAAGHTVTVKTDFPEVFHGLKVGLQRFDRNGCNVIAHYSSRKSCDGTNQWQDICINAGIPEIPLQIDWEITNRPLVNDLKAMAKGRPIIMVNGGRPPMGRTDGYGHEMLPRREVFDQVLAVLGDCFTVEVGKGTELYPLTADVDLSGRTSPADLLDIASASCGLVGQCSFMIPLAEALDKPLLVVWAAAGLQSATEFVRLCKPEKILSKPSSRWVMDNWTPGHIDDAARAFRAVV